MPGIQPNTPLAPSYNIGGSKAFVVNSQLDFSNIARTFTVSFAAGVPAGLAIEFVRVTAPGGSVDLVALAATPGVIDSTSIPGRNVSASSGPTSLSGQIQDPSESGVLNEHYELRVSADIAVDWIYTVDNEFNSSVIRVVCDPVAAFNGLPASLLEKQGLSLTADSAAGPSATPTVVRNTSTANGLIALPPPVPTYQFGHLALISILGLPSQPQTSQTYEPVDEFGEPIPLPGVYSPTPVPFTLDVVYPNVGGTAFLTNHGVGNSTINARPQRVQLILDRSGSMGAEHRWDNAKTAARIFINFFGEFRAGVNADDLIGVTVFEDPNCVFRPSGPAGPPFITDVIPLDAPDKVASGDLGPAVFGVPENCTPIGDGLYFGLQKLQERGFPQNVHFTVALMSDGEQNCGRIKIGPPPDPNGAISFEQAKTEPAIKDITAPTTDLDLFTIALGSSADFPVLDGLAAKGHFVAALNVGNLINGYATMFKTSQEANKLNTRSRNLPTDPVSTTEVFFDTTQAQRFGVAVLKKLDPATPAEDITDVEIALFDGQDFLVQGIVAEPFEGHFYIGVPNASGFGDNGSATWRIRRFNSASEAQPIDPADVIAFEDLHVKSALSLDKKNYLTGEEMRLAVEIRNDSRPVLGATVLAALDAPAEGTGSLLAALDADDMQRQLRRTEGKDQPAPRQAMIEAVLAKYDWDGLPRCNPDPGGLFTDGSNVLHDVDGTGIYTNTFDKVNADGVYNWTVTVQGVDAGNHPFNHRLDQSTLAAVSISRKRTTIRQERLSDQPPGFTAVKVTITPQDDFKELLGPGFDDVVIWAIRGDGVFEHVKNKVDPPVNTDGTYTRTVIFRRRERPTLLVSVRGVILPKIELGEGPHHFDDDSKDD